MTKKEKTVLMMAAGTGGHVFPALSLAKVFKEKGYRVCWLGTKTGIEVRLVGQERYPLYALPVKGLRGKRLLKLIMAPSEILRSFLMSAWIILKVKPEVVVGMGGYVSGPGGLAAKLLGKRLVLHEQNAIPGLTNRLLSKISSATLCAFPGTFSASAKAHCIGNPVREEISTLSHPFARYNDRSGPLRILVFGGSLGARVFNQMLPKCVSGLGFDVEVWHQSGKAGLSDAQAGYQKHFPSARVDAFIDDMAEAYAWADLVVCRAGALTVSELMAAGVASILIPYPYAVDDHQTANAKALVSVGAAILMQETEFSIESLSAQLTLLSQREVLREMAVCAYNCRQINATQQAVFLCLS